MNHKSQHEIPTATWRRVLRTPSLYQREFPKYSRFHDPGTFDKDFGTLQSPGVRADAQCFKLTWLEELASESNTIQATQPHPEGLETLLVSERDVVRVFALNLKHFLFCDCAFNVLLI